MPENKADVLGRLRGEVPKLPIHFFNRDQSAVDILAAAANFKGTAHDDSALGQLELDMCEAFSSCSSDGYRA